MDASLQTRAAVRRGRSRRPDPAGASLERAADAPTEDESRQRTVVGYSFHGFLRDIQTAPRRFNSATTLWTMRVISC